MRDLKKKHAPYEVARSMVIEGKRSNVFPMYPASRRLELPKHVRELPQVGVPNSSLHEMGFEN